MGTITTISSLVMIALFAIAMTGFAINFAEENDAAIDIADDPEALSLYSDTLQEGVDAFREDSEDQYQSIVDSTIEPGSQTTPSSAPYAITNTNVVNVTSNMLRTGYQKIFGTGEGFGIFFTVFVSLIVFMLGLYLIKTWRGNPD